MENTSTSRNIGDTTASRVVVLAKGNMGRSSGSNISDSSVKMVEVMSCPLSLSEQADSNISTRQPSPEKKPSRGDLKDNGDDDDDEDRSNPPVGQDQSNSENDLNPNPNNNNININWSTEQFGKKTHCFHEVSGIINQFRFNCGMLVNNGRVQFFIIVLICINAIMMGIGTYSFVKDNEHLDNIFEMVDLVFLIIFSVELGLQTLYHGWRLILDGWLVFDMIIIITSWTFSSVQIIRAFRIFRALRLVTRIKVMKNLIIGTLHYVRCFGISKILKENGILTYTFLLLPALFGVVPRMAAIGLMLALIFYIFAVMFTQLFKDLYENGDTDYNYFSGIDWTLFTLFQMMTLDNWATIARQVMAVHSWAWFPFITFVIISGFIVVNLIIAVICDAISNLHSDDKAMMSGVNGEETDSDSVPPTQIREQLDCLEEQMEELTRIQARTFHTLQYLTRQMQMQKLKQELQTTKKALAIKPSQEKMPALSS
jgi:hypothetical protein